MKEKKIKKRVISVIIVIVLAIMFGLIAYRGSYLEISEIGEKYLAQFNKKNEYILYAFLINFLIVYLLTYIITTKVKKGLRVFFEQEKKEMPKLPRKSIAFIGGILISVIVCKGFAKKATLFFGATFFEKATPIFGRDIGYFIFQKPFIEAALLYLLFLIIAALVYSVIYYITVFNVFFEGIDKETLKNSKFIKQIINKIIAIAFVIGGIIYIKTENVVLQKFVNIVGTKVAGAKDYSLYGAGVLDVTIKLWGYRIFAAVMIISVLLGIKYFKQKNTKKVLKSILIVPVYLIILFTVLVVGKLIYVKPNELDIQKQYIDYNISSTKTAYGIDIDEVVLENSGTITKQTLAENSDVINNINIVGKDVLLKDLNGSQTAKKYYHYDNTMIGKYDINGQSRLVYLSPREIVNNEKTRTYNNKTYEYTHGFGAIISSATDVNENGNINNIQKSFTEDEIIKIQQPRIYYGVTTNNTVVTNENQNSEFDFPIIDSKKSNNATNTYDGKAGLNLNLLDRIVLAIKEKNAKLIVSKNVSSKSKILINRNIIQRAKQIMPELVYDQNPYMVVSDEGKLVWVLDAYTISDNYPYSQKTMIEVEGGKREINYIRNSVKVLIDAYDGEVKFYITDRTDPIVMAYNKIYPEVFEDVETVIPQSISKHFVYPEFLYNIQASIIEKYHNVGADVLYRSDDVWQKATQNTGKAVSKVGTQVQPYYTSMKLLGDEEKLGLILPFTPYEKQNIISYLVGAYDENGNSSLTIYKFSEDSNVLGPIQLDTQIEQNDTIASEIESLNTTGVKLMKNIVMVPMDNTMLYVEPIYQLYTNETNALPALKKVIVASGNKVAIGDTLTLALESLVSQYAVDIEVENTDNMEDLISAVIKANNNLATSTNNNDWEMMGKDLRKLQDLIQKLDKLKQEEEEKKTAQGANLQSTSLEVNANETVI